MSERVLIEALRGLEPFLPSHEDIHNNAARNGGQASAFHLAALKAHNALAGTELSVNVPDPKTGDLSYLSQVRAADGARP